jgi:hypothetical protein
LALWRVRLERRWDHPAPRGFRSRSRSSRSEGPPKQIRRTPPVHLLNPRPTHPPAEFVSLGFFLSTFSGVSRQGEFKNTTKIFLQKALVENFFRKNRQIFDVSFSSTFFVLSRFRAMGVQKHYKKRFTKKSCRKVFTKYSTKNPKPTFSRFILITFLGVSR